MGIKDVDIVKPHAFEALIETGNQILARSPIAVRTFPHRVAGLGADQQLIAISGEIGLQDAPEILFGRTRRRTVIVGEIKVGDSEIEGPAQHRTAILEHINSAEIVPEAEGNRREINAALAAAA